MSIDVIVVDDEPLARDRVRQLLASAPDFHIVAECRDGVEAVEAIAHHQPDVVFLDVQMPEMDGLAVIEEVGVEQMPFTVFTTAYDRYAIAAFDRHALDYLLKPIDDLRFADTLARVRRFVDGDAPPFRPPLQALVAERPPRTADRFLVRRGESLVFLRSADIDWIESIGNYVALHTGSGKFVHRGTLSALEERLDPRRFLRIHRGAIVQIDRVLEIHDDLGRLRVVLRDGTDLPLSRRCKQRLAAFEP